LGLLSGINELNLDAKGRMAMPACYREPIAESCDGDLVVTVDQDTSLLIYPKPEWEELERKLVKLPSFVKEARVLQRLLLGHATHVKLDNSGRLLIPPMLRDFARLDKRIVLIGQGNKFELWDDERWYGLRNQWIDDSKGDKSLPEQLGNFSL
jgi:MraZ protein